MRRSAPAPSRPWRSALAVIVAVVPLYGYLTHASRDAQFVAFVVLACWIATCILALGTVAMAASRPHEDPRRRRRLRLASLALVVAALAGWGGVRAAILELLAG